jgi:hypothetical protein
MNVSSKSVGVGVLAVVLVWVGGVANVVAAPVASGRPGGVAGRASSGGKTLPPLPVAGLNIPVAAARPAVPSSVRVGRKSDTALRVRWGKVAGARSYRVHRLVEGKWEVVKVTSSLSWVEKKLPKRTVQQYRVAACAKVRGKAPCSSKSVGVSATTYSPNDETVNVQSIKFLSLPESLGVHDVRYVHATLTPAQSGKVEDLVPVSTEVRLLSSDPSVVSVSVARLRWFSVKGVDPVPVRLVAEGFGSSVITVIAHNGVSASFRVSVVDSSCPIEIGDLSERWSWESSVYTAPLVASRGAQICALARYALSHPVGDGVVTINGRGKFVVERGGPQLDAYAWGLVRSILSADRSYRSDITFVDHAFIVTLYFNDIPCRREGSECMAIAYVPHGYYLQYYALDQAVSGHWYTGIRNDVFALSSTP